MSHAKEYHVGICSHVSRKLQVCIACKILVYRCDVLSGIASALDERDHCMGMIQKYADQFTAGIARTANYAHLYFHCLFFPFCKWSPSSFTCWKMAVWLPNILLNPRT